MLKEQESILLQMLELKALDGIKNALDFTRLIEVGADCIGTSSGANIMKEYLQ